MEFRDRLLRTLHALRPVLDVDGVMIVGSEVPNLLEPDARSSLVVSEDIDIAVPVASHEIVKNIVLQLPDFRQSSEEPSVFVPADLTMIEVNFLGMDPAIIDPLQVEVLDDSEFPLLIFGTLSMLQPVGAVIIEGESFPLPRPSGLILEKLLSDRTGPKGERDLLVALGMMLVMTEKDRQEAIRRYADLPVELRYAIRSNLTRLSLLSPHSEMPDPRVHREGVCSLLRDLEKVEGKV